MHASGSDRSPDSPDHWTRREFVAASVATGLAAAAAPRCGLRRRLERRDAEGGRRARATPRSSIPRPARIPASSSGPTRSGCARRCATSAGASRPKAMRCSCRIRSIASARRRCSTTPRTSTSRTGDAREDQPLMGSVNAAGRRREGRGRVRRVPRRAAAGRQGEEDRHAGLLHGRPARRADRRGGARSHRRRRRRSTAAVSSPTSPTARTCSRRRSRRACTSASPRTTISASPTRRTSCSEAFAAANVPAEIEVYPAKHGWCVPDMPTDAGAPIYNKPEAERAWGKLARALQGRARLIAARTHAASGRAPSDQRRGEPFLLEDALHGRSLEQRAR